MEEVPLLTEEKLQRKWIAPNWNLFLAELKRVSYIALPMVVVNVSQLFLRLVSMMMVGHLSELEFAGASIAISVTNATGFSVLFGMASALETLCGQAYGAGLYHKLGIYTYGAIVSLVLVCLPISILWIFMDKLLVMVGQDELISYEAGKFTIWLIPSLFPYAILQAQIRYLQTQSLILPMLLSSVAALVFHVPVCWGLAFYFRLGNAGAALAMGLSNWFNVILIFMYAKYAAEFEKTRLAFSKDVFSSIGEFFRFAVPSSVMVCLEWWTYETVILLSGLLPNPQRETSVLSICLLIAAFHYYVPFSLGAAASTRVSNELGAGNPGAAKMVVWAVIAISMAEAIMASAAVSGCRKFLGYAFSNEKEVVEYFMKVSPLVCLVLITDGIQTVLSGVARGCGWQHLGAYVNLGAFYLAGIPVSTVLGFVIHLNGVGLWLGLNAGSAVQSVLLGLITSFTNWKKEAIAARGRMFDASSFPDVEYSKSAHVPENQDRGEPSYSNKIQDL
ncbi:OLC1v1010692C1 [Oldenlandia corymbosa var. corymbosa]|uniref:Protein DETOXIFICATION n=1 Tax=Oldenlandia corymbosa var. corymbosa TaxID=529605 RepID=A0AAV1DUA3_OLDCO|nr:OLC1v1010692C1 [Oldenlandia corymbosa var. corymbosa]